MRVIGLYGSGGFAREVMPMLHQFEYDKVYFVEPTVSVKTVNGYEVISEKDFEELKSKTKMFNVAIGDSIIRKRISDTCLSKNMISLDIYHRNLVKYDDVSIDDGAIICAGCIITSNVKIGKFFHMNLRSYVAHDCVIGDYVTFAPAVCCNGNVHVEDYAYIGTGAIIKHGTKDNPIIIGEGAVVGMGAVVTKSVPPYTTVVGNPAKPFGG